MKAMVFVFGSNRAGVHGAGAAKFAFDHCGAVWGIGEGHTGDSYALPTCDHEIRPLKLEQIKEGVARFLDFARKNPQLQFQVTRVGCGLAGFTDAADRAAVLDRDRKCLAAECVLSRRLGAPRRF